MEVEEEGADQYTCRYTVTTRMTSALRWAASRAIFVSLIVRDKNHKTVSTDRKF